MLIPAWLCQRQGCEREPSCSSARLTCQSTKPSTPKAWQISNSPSQLDSDELWEGSLKSASCRRMVFGFVLEFSMPEEQLAGLEWCRRRVKAQTHLGTLKASLMLSQCPKILVLAQLHPCSLPRSCRITGICLIFRWGGWKKIVHEKIEDVWGKKNFWE